MKDNSVSLIVPTYNLANSLNRCLSSYFSQTVRPVEVIVINDSSTVCTADIVRSYGEQIVFPVQENLGQGAT